ncbi:hypothetical protein [Pseudomonas oryzihabitans]|nr:hypothetical protein [Pseudomonas psychrotolerans]
MLVDLLPIALLILAMFEMQAKREQAAKDDYREKKPVHRVVLE